MKGFLGGLFVAAPLTAFIVMLTMGGQQEVRTQQERMQTQQRIDELEFDQDFDRAFGSDTQDKTERRSQELAEAREQKEMLDESWEKQFSDLDRQLDDMRGALAEQEPEKLEW